MDIEKILINNHIINQIENDQKNSLIKHLLDSKEKYKQEMTDMLSDILKKLLPDGRETTNELYADVTELFKPLSVVP